MSSRCACARPSRPWPMTDGTSSSTTACVGLTGPALFKFAPLLGQLAARRLDPGDRLTYDRRMTVVSTATTSTADGRTLAFCEWGDPKGAPVFSLHGTPGSRLTRHPDSEVYCCAVWLSPTTGRANGSRPAAPAHRSRTSCSVPSPMIADAPGIERSAATCGSVARSTPWPAARSCWLRRPALPASSGRLRTGSDPGGAATNGCAGLLQGTCGRRSWSWRKRRCRVPSSSCQANLMLSTSVMI